MLNKTGLTGLNRNLSSPTGTQDNFFNKFNSMPFWYQALFIGVVSAIYGLKGADIMGKRK